MKRYDGKVRSGRLGGKVSSHGGQQQGVSVIISKKLFSPGSYVQFKESVVGFYKYTVNSVNIAFLQKAAIITYY